jgi:subtilisin-like proprotein convertase family protein
VWAAQNCQSDVTIPNNDLTGATSTCTISDQSGTVKDLTVVIDKLTHGHVGELEMTLTHDGTTVTLMDRPEFPKVDTGCRGQNLTNLKINDAGSKTLHNDCIPYDPAYDDAVQYKANNPLLSAFNGRSINGDWVLTVKDKNIYNTLGGTLNTWHLEYDVNSSADLVDPTPSNGTTVSFSGDIPVGKEGTTTIQIKGDKELKIYSAKAINKNTGDVKDEFTLTKVTKNSTEIAQDFAITLEPNITYGFEVTCEPTNEGLRTATFQITTNIPTLETLEYPLKCTGKAAEYSATVGGTVLSNGADVDFGSVDFDTDTSTKTFTINAATGAANLIIEKVKFQGGAAGDYSFTTLKPADNTTLEAGKSTSFGVKCTPKRSKARNTTLIIKTNDPSNREVKYNLKCIGLGSHYTATPEGKSPLSFGSIVDGGTVTAQKSISVKNTGNEQLDSDVKLEGDAADLAAFSLSATDRDLLVTSLALGVNKTEVVTITCSPPDGDTAPKTYSATLKIPHDGPKSEDAYYTLTCSKAAEVEAVYDSEPVAPKGEFNIGSAVIGNTVSNTFNILEMGSATLIVNEKTVPSITGADATLFEIKTPVATATPFIQILNNGTPQEVKIQCSPVRKGSNHTARLNLTSNDPNNANINYDLTCTGKAPVYDSDLSIGDTLDIGSKPVGASISKNLQVKNTGDSTLSVTSCDIENDDKNEFSTASCSFTVNAGNNKNLAVTCSPKDLGTRTAKLIVHSNGYEAEGDLKTDAEYNLTCIGQRPVGPGYDSTPAAPNAKIDFGKVTVGKKVTYDLTMKEVNNSVIFLNEDTPLMQGSHAVDFKLDTTLPNLISANTQQDITLSCTPSEKGVREATFNITSTGKVYSNLSYPLVCEGIQPAYSSDPVDTIDFGNTDVGVKTTQTLTISETGTDKLTVNLAETPITGDNAADFAIKDTFPISIADGGTAVEVELSCTPSGKENRTATLHLTSNDPDKTTIDYTLKCYGNPKPAYDSEPKPKGEIDLGGGYLNYPLTNTLTIKEIGTDTLKVKLADTPFTGDHASDFSVNSSEFPVSIDDDGEDVDVTLTCTPTVEGTRTATLNLTSNDEDLTEITYTVKCIGSIEPIPVYGSNPAISETIDFGSADVGKTLNKTLNIQERGTATLNVDLASNPITGTHASNFTVDSSLFPMAIEYGGAAIDVGLTCTPSAGGTRIATLNLVTNDATRPNVSYGLKCNGLVDDGETPQGPSIPQYKLTIQFEGNGSGTVTTKPNNIACSNHGAHDQCTNDYVQDAKLQLTPTPNHDAYFVGWSDNCKSENITLNSDKTCVATFELLPTYTLNVLIIGEGEVNSSQYPNFNCHSERVEKCFLTDLIQDTTVNLQPTPLDGWSFAGWEADCNSNGQVVMTSDKACHAIFTPNTTEKVKFSVSIRSGSGTIISDSVPELTCQNNTGSCAGEYNIESIMGVIAIADKPYIFAGWTGDCSDAGKSTTHSLQLVKPETHCIADFAFPPPDPVEQPKPDTKPDEPTDTDKPTDEPSDDSEERPQEEQPKVKCLTEGRLNYACNAEGETVKNLKVLPTGSISNIVIEGEVDNEGWVSDSKVKSGGKISGGTLTGQTKLEDGGILENVTLKGDLIEGGTLRGETRNQSPVGGVIKNVLLDDNAVIKNGYVDGTIKGNPSDTCQPTARLENLIVLHNAVLNNIVIGEGVKFGSNVEFGDCVIVADGSIYRPDQDEIDENGTVHLAKDSYVSDGELNGHFVGDDEGLPLLEDVLIGDDSTVDNVILGQDVVNKGEVTNFELRGIDFRGGKIGGEIDVTRGGTIEDVTLAPDTVIDGGNFKGDIIGDPDAPATIKNGFINADACINNVILGKGTTIAEGACIGKNVIDEEPEQSPEETPEIEDMLQIEPNGSITSSAATFDPRVAVCDIPRTNNTLLSKRDAKGVELQAHIGVDPIHQGLPGEMLMVARHNFHNSITDMMKLPDGSWTDWNEGMDIVGFQTFDALPEGIDTFVFKGNLGEVRGEISVFMGYRLTDGTTVYNGGEPLRIFIDTTPDTCLVYAIHDEGLNETQPVIIDLSVGLDGDMRLLGTERRFYGYDIEGMELHPDDDNLLLGTGGDDSNVYGKEQDGHLYTINKTTGHISKIGRIVSSDGSIEFEQVAGIALHPVTKQLWGWGIVNRKDKFMAILHIDHNTGVSRIHKQFEHSQMNNVTGLTWSRDGDVMFMSSEDRLWRYNPNTQQMKVKCEDISNQVVDFLKARDDKSQLKLIGGRKGEIEGLDIQPNGWLLIGIDYQASTASSIVAYDAETCEVKQIQTFRNSVFHDLESVVWPVKACNDQSWLNEDPCADFGE